MDASSIFIPKKSVFLSLRSNDVDYTPFDSVPRLQIKNRVRVQQHNTPPQMSQRLVMHAAIFASTMVNMIALAQDEAQKGKHQ